MIVLSLRLYMYVLWLVKEREKTLRCEDCCRHRRRRFFFWWSRSRARMIGPPPPPPLPRALPYPQFFSVPYNHTAETKHKDIQRDKKKPSSVA